MPIKDAKMTNFLEVAIYAAKEAGEIQRGRLFDEMKTEPKGEGDLVTEVDRLCDERIKEIIHTHFPDHGILSEEGSIGDGSPYKWIIDPLDGTLNYAHVYPFFCVSIGLEIEGEVALGVVYDPTRDELFWAEKGKGSHLNGKKIRVSKTEELKRALIAVGFPKDYRRSPIDNFDHFRNMMMDSQAVRRDGSMALDLCYVAAGRLDGFWGLKLDPWDIAAGKILVEEAGGTVTDFDDKPIGTGSVEIAASNGVIHEELTRVLRQGKRPGRFYKSLSAT